MVIGVDFGLVMGMGFGIVTWGWEWLTFVYQKIP